MCEQERAGGAIRGEIYYWGYVFYVAKYYDFVDTMLLIARKEPLKFIHWYHHAIVPISVWYAFDQQFAMPVFSACLFNSAVHAVMYVLPLTPSLARSPRSLPSYHAGTTTISELRS